MDAALAGLLNVIVGGALAVSSTATVEFFKDRRERRQIEADRSAQQAEEARKAYHDLVSSLQEALRKMTDLAGELSVEEPDRDEDARRREKLRRAELDCEKLISRLPDEDWRKSILRVVRAADEIRTSEELETVNKMLDPARSLYVAALDTLAEPLRNFYRDAGLSMGKGIEASSASNAIVASESVI